VAARDLVVLLGAAGAAEGGVGLRARERVFALGVAAGVERDVIV
jgi:hypothetical protein